jgi:transposase
MLEGQLSAQCCGAVALTGSSVRRRSGSRRNGVGTEAAAPLIQRAGSATGMTMQEAEETVTADVLTLGSRAPARKAETLDDPAVRGVLQLWVRAPTTPQRVVLRSRIILLLLEGLSTRKAASRLGVSRTTVELWTKRFAENGVNTLLRDAPGRGRHARMTAAMMRDRLRQANLLRPDDLPVSMRRAAAVLGVSPSSVWRALHEASISRGAGIRGRSRMPADS